uniref:hypothetical protein n=1 Tax=Thaumasiovibrio occultus TaxID=1891184 RepID=UPI000B361821|nr:hypothetical protein [Thaumasiovibrio occultus]
MKKIALCATLLSSCVFGSAIADDVLRQYIPADTPLLLSRPASAKGITLSATQRQFLDALSEKWIGEPDAENADSTGYHNRLFLSSLYRGLFVNYPSPDAHYQQMGIDASQASYFYTLGLQPVHKFVLSDEKQFWRYIDTLANEAKATYQEKTLEDVSYRVYRLHDDAVDFPLLIIAVNDDVATFTLDSPASSSAPSANVSNLTQALGLEKPAQSLANNQTLNQLKREYASANTAGGLGYIDIRQIVAGFTQLQQGQLATQLNEIAKGDPKLQEQIAIATTPACQRDFTAIANNWPRIIIHYGADQQAFNLDFTLESNNSTVMNALFSAQGQNPAFITERHTELAASFGLKGNSLANAIITIANELQTPASQCEPIAKVQQQMKSMDFNRAHILTPILFGLEGVSYALNNSHQGELKPTLNSESDMMLSIRAQNPIQWLLTTTATRADLAQAVSKLRRAGSGVEVDVTDSLTAPFDHRIFAQYQGKNAFLYTQGAAREVISDNINTDVMNQSLFTLAFDSSIFNNEFHLENLGIDQEIADILTSAEPRENLFINDLPEANVRYNIRIGDDNKIYFEGTATIK